MQEQNWGGGGGESKLARARAREIILRHKRSTCKRPHIIRSATHRSGSGARTAILIIIFDGAVPQPLAKDRLLHTVSVGSTGNAAIRGRFVFVANEHEARRARGDPFHARGCDIPQRICRVTCTEGAVDALCPCRASLAFVYIWIDNVLFSRTTSACPQSSRKSRSKLFDSLPSCDTREARHCGTCLQ